MNKLLLAFLLFFTGQAAIWFQTNGQFVWPWFKKNPFAISVLFGTAISFTFLTWYFLGEGITPKTVVSLVMACSLIGIQIFWK